MNRRAAVDALTDIASGIGSSCIGSEWYLFGSIARDDLAPNDLDLMILCVDHAQADILRVAINPDALDLPLDLSLLTFEEAAEIDAIGQQKAQKFFPDRIVEESRKEVALLSGFSQASASGRLLPFMPSISGS